MPENPTLSIGPIVMDLPEWPELELLAVFRDDMFHSRRVAASPSKAAEERQESKAPAQPVEEFRAPGQVISARLDLMGHDQASTLARLDRGEFRWS